MPSYQNNQIGIAALVCLLLWSTPVAAQRADTEQPLNLIGDAAISDPANAVSETDQPPVQANADSGQTVANDADQGAVAPAADNSLANTSAAYAQVNLGRRKISEVGLAAIGVGDGDANERGLDSMIWRGTAASDAVFLLEKAAVVSHSQALTNLSYQVVAKQSVPPSGANLVAGELVAARLAWLARAGRSHDLAVLANQLPDSPRWASWKRWLVEHELMMRNDAVACDIVDAQVAATMEPFWHKANVICHAVKGNVVGARFAADILAANGVEDPVFFALTNEMLTGVPAENIDPNTLDTMHIVLMDVVNRSIPLESLAVLPSQMAQSVVQLKFLGADARMVSTFDGLSRGLIDHNQVSKLWRNAGPVDSDPQLALAQLDGEATALTTAMAWRAIDADTSPQRLARIAAAMAAEIVDGNGALMLPLYAELIADEISDANAAADMRFNEDGVAPKISMLLAIAKPDDIALIEGFTDNDDALRAAKLMKMIDRGALQSGVVSELDMWPLVPVLQAAGAVMPDQDWLVLAKDAALTQQPFISLSPIVLAAVTQAADNRRVAETILLTNWLLQTGPLETINPKDMAKLVTALRSIGQEDVAKELSKEILRAHLLSRFAVGRVDGTAS
ncbi:MAG: hypothetical protein O3C44_03885 [Proteobacteria bacterium]|nr:hypothetical protein [Pseudomonadota bacterium]